MLVLMVMVISSGVGSFGDDGMIRSDDDDDSDELWCWWCY